LRERRRRQLWRRLPVVCADRIPTFIAFQLILFESARDVSCGIFARGWPRQISLFLFVATAGADSDVRFLSLEAFLLPVVVIVITISHPSDAFLACLSDRRRASRREWCYSSKSGTAMTGIKCAHLFKNSILKFSYPAR